MPQNRDRLFIVGLLKAKEIPKRRFRWPQASTNVPGLDAFLEADVASPPVIPNAKYERRNYLKCLHEIYSEGGRPTQHYIADLGNGFKNSVSMFKGLSPCLTRNHAMADNFYVFSRGRKLVLREYFRLQGIDPDRFIVPSSIPARHLRAMLGNAWCVPVFTKILDRALFAVGLTHAPIAFTYGDADDVGHPWPEVGLHPEV